jgi:hypothetical protein
MSAPVTPELLAGLAGAAISLITSYVPGLNTWFEKLSGTAKRLVMAGVLAATALVIAVSSCAKPDETALFVCLGGLDWQSYMKALIAALVANQATFKIAGEGKE